MAEIVSVYEGDLHCRVTHLPSGATLLTDAPADNHGKGEGFSPTDLLASALGSCILSVMAIAAKVMKLDLTGTTATVRKQMVNKPVRRIGTLAVTIDVPVVLNDAQRARLVTAAMTCPVHKSLHPDVQMPIEFRWAESP
jgi:putative redox protein